MSRFVRAVNPLPSGTATVGIGLIASGVFTYVYLALARRSLDDEAYSAFAVVWGLVFIVGPGLFQPLEQEIARAAAHRATRGVGVRPLVLRAATLGLVGLVGVSVLAALGWSVGLDELLGDRAGLLGTMLACFAGFLFVNVVRGVIGGRRNFGDYSRTLGLEGATRLGGAVLLALASVTTPEWFGAILALSLVSAATVGLLRPRPFLDAGPPASWREVSPALGILLTMSLSEALLLNIGPAVVSALSDDEAAPGVFLSALVVARLPLFVFQAVKVALLPAVTTSAAQGDLVSVRGTLHRLLVATGALAAAAVVGCAVLGPAVVRILFDDEVQRSDMALLAAANGTAMLVIALSVALTGLGREAIAALSWVLGVVVFGMTLLARIEAILRVELAMLFGFTAAALAMAFALWPVWRATDNWDGGPAAEVRVNPV